jgi:hypothetical protein
MKPAALSSNLFAYALAVAMIGALLWLGVNGVVRLWLGVNGVVRRVQQFIKDGSVGQSYV